MSDLVNFILGWVAGAMSVAGAVCFYYAFRPIRRPWDDDEPGGGFG